MCCVHPNPGRTRNKVKSSEVMKERKRRHIVELLCLFVFQQVLLFPWTTTKLCVSVASVCTTLAQHTVLLCASEVSAVNVLKVEPLQQRTLSRTKMEPYFIAFGAGIGCLIVLSMLQRPLSMCFWDQSYEETQTPSFHIFRQSLSTTESLKHQLPSWSDEVEGKFKLLEPLIDLFKLYLSCGMKRASRSCINLRSNLVHRNGNQLSAAEVELFFNQLATHFLPSSFTNRFVNFDEAFRAELKEKIAIFDDISITSILSKLSEVPKTENVFVPWYCRCFPGLTMLHRFHLLFSFLIPLAVGVGVYIGLETDSEDSGLIVDSFGIVSGGIPLVAHVMYWITVYFVCLLPLLSWLPFLRMIRSETHSWMLRCLPIGYEEVLHKHIGFEACVCFLTLATLVALIDNGGSNENFQNASMSTAFESESVEALYSLTFYLLPLLLLQEHGANGLIVVLKFFLLDGIFQWLNLVLIAHISAGVSLLLILSVSNSFAAYLISISWITGLVLPRVLLLCWCQRGQLKMMVDSTQRTSAFLLDTEESRMIQSSGTACICRPNVLPGTWIPVPVYIRRLATESKRSIEIRYDELDSHPFFSSSLEAILPDMQESAIDAFCCLPSLLECFLSVCFFPLLHASLPHQDSLFSSSTPVNLYVAPSKRLGIPALSVSIYSNLVLMIDDAGVEAGTSSVLHYLRQAQQRRLHGFSKMWVNCKFKKRKSVYMIWNRLRNFFLEEMIMISKVEEVKGSMAKALSGFSLFIELKQDDSMRYRVNKGERLLLNLSVLPDCEPEMAYELMLFRKFLITGLLLRKEAFLDPPSFMPSASVLGKPNQRVLVCAFGLMTLACKSQLYCKRLRRLCFETRLEVLDCSHQVNKMQMRMPYFS